MTLSTHLAPHVDVQDLVVTYGRRCALDGLDLTLGPGVHGLLGPNGAGKTTLMRVLATVVAPSSGSVRLLGGALDGREVERDARRRLGYLPQTFGFYPRFRVREFVEYIAWLKEVPGPQVPIAVDRAIERVGLTDRAEDRMRSLSGGMLRRVGIAQAIVNDPDLLLLDEPTAGLDPEQRVALRTLLREIGVDSCVLVSTHLVEDVAAACSTVTLLDAGRAVFRGTPDELAAAGAGGAWVGAAGDTPAERGYTAVLRAARGPR
ncbi:ABC transporter ATP-binding protein [Cellulomonas sp. P24]|uniref:ABC transporter ATP-binding protein n=1 Tax=Cellulomonas sp. P24 TaxID=2885206 RepID=UPI00216ADE90|nr:ABC transporter ATP-binding protein [Cellulomonas sp. P24]MCR6491170.1 ABC transporter ATP-binding protein [Cellulomonas sp. P24]